MNISCSLNFKICIFLKKKINNITFFIKYIVYINKLINKQLLEKYLSIRKERIKPKAFNTERKIIKKSKIKKIQTAQLPIIAFLHTDFNKRKP